MITLYNSCVLSVLLYGAACWRMTEKDMNKLSSFHNGCLKNLHERAKSTDMSTLLKKYHWQWIGHVLRKPMNDITKISLRWTREGIKKEGRQKTTWRRTVEADLKEMESTWAEIEKKAQDRGEWKSLVIAYVPPGATRTR